VFSTASAERCASARAMSRSVSSNRRPDSFTSSVIEPSFRPCAAIGTQIVAGVSVGSSHAACSVS